MRSNLIKDEEGEFLQWEEFSEFKTIVEAKQVLAAIDKPPEFLDELRKQILPTENLEFLRRAEPRSADADRS